MACRKRQAAARSGIEDGATALYGADGSDTEIYLWKEGGTTTQITNNTISDAHPTISGLNVVWMGSPDGSDSEIYMTTIPEPSTALLLAFGLVGLAVGGRRWVR